MARLQIEQIAAPNQSAAAAMLAGAGQSFNQGLSAASSLLDKYAIGQQERGDQEILADIAGLQTEDELGAYLQSGVLEGKNLSAEMRQNVLGLRDNIIGYGQGRADIRQTEANIGLTNANTGLVGANTNRVNVATGIAQAAEDRTSADWVYGNQRRDEQSAIAGQYASALAEGQQGGLQPYAGGGGNVAEGGLLQEFEGLVTTPYNDPATDRDGNQVGPNIYRAGYGSNTYTTEDGQVHTVTAEYGGTEADARRDLERRNTEEYNPVIAQTLGPDAFSNLSPQQLEVAQSLLHNYGKAAFDGVLAPVAAAMRSGDAQAVARAIESMQGQNGGVNDRRRLAEAAAFLNGNTGPAAPSGPQGEITQNAPLSPAAQQLMAAVAQGSTFTMADVDNMFSGINGATDRGQTQIDAAEQARVADVAAQTTIDALQDPNVLNAAGVASANLGNAALSPADQLAAAAQGRAVAEGNQDILAPATTVDPLVAAQVASDERTRQRGVDALPQTRILATAERYGDDAIGGLVADLGIGADDEDARSYVFGLFGENADENQLRRHINTIAEQAGVTPAMAAAAMADEFNRDPWGINRNSRRFNPDSVVQYLNETVGMEGMLSYEGALVAQEVADSRSQGAQLQIQTLQSQLAKTTDPRRREQIQNNINQLVDQTLSGVTPQQAVQQLEDYVRSQAGMASRLREAQELLQSDPESTEAFRAISDLETQIQGDTNLSDREKQLLITTLRG